MYVSHLCITHMWVCVLNHTHSILLLPLTVPLRFDVDNCAILCVAVVRCILRSRTSFYPGNVLPRTLLTRSSLCFAATLFLVLCHHAGSQLPVWSPVGGPLVWTPACGIVVRERGKCSENGSSSCSASTLILVLCFHAHPRS